MIKKLILVLVLLVPFTASAEFSIAGGSDILHATGQHYAEVRYRHTLYDGGWDAIYADEGDRFGFSVYVGTMDTVGVDLFQTWGKFMFGLGVEYAEPNEDVIDTEGGYELLLEYALTEQWALSLKHRSNCRYVCRTVPGLSALPKGPEDKSNVGYNFLTVRYSW